MRSDWPCWRSTARDVPEGVRTTVKELVEALDHSINLAGGITEDLADL